MRVKASYAHTHMYLYNNFLPSPAKVGFAMKHGGGADFRLMQETEL